MAKILCVDDEDDLREEIADELRCEGYEVFEARSAREGLDIMSRIDLDLVLCDVSMPAQSGHEMLKDVRANHPGYDGIPFVFLTALAGHADMIAGLKMGADDYLGKPVDFEILRSKVQSSLRLRAAYLSQLKHISTTDRRTGLPNRYGAEDHLSQMIATAHDVAVICIGLDEFKMAGGALTDQERTVLLGQTAERLLQISRSRDVNDYVATMENGIFLYVASSAGSSAFAEVVVREMIDKLEKPSEGFDQAAHVSLHAGIYLSQDITSAASMVIDGAMMALVLARRDNVAYRLYRADMKTVARRTMKLKNSLHSALENEELFLEYQPQVDARTGALIGAEALLRWRSVERGVIPPDHFIPLAEQSREIIPIGRWVLETAIAQASSWQRIHGPGLRMAVNFSSCQFQEVDNVKIVSDALEAGNLKPELLDIEITERMLLLDDAATLATIHGLLELGVRLSIDDFGTGYSSLGFLKKTPFSTVKIDRSFIENITSSHRDAVLVDTLIKMSHDLDMEVVAEGVETEGQLDLLRRQCCEMIQGFLIGRPMKPGNFAKIFLEIPGVGSTPSRMPGGNPPRGPILSTKYG